MKEEKFIQPMMWHIQGIPEQFKHVSAVTLPEVWKEVFYDLKVDEAKYAYVPFYNVFKLVAPEIIYFFPNAFQWKSRDPSKYWFVAEKGSKASDPENIIKMMSAWLVQVAPAKEARQAIVRIKENPPEARVIDLTSESTEIQEQVLPGLVARLLVQKGYHIHMRPADDAPTQSWPMRLVSEHNYAPKAELVSWPPVEKYLGDATHYYSYVMHFYVDSVAGSQDAFLACRIGIRRWVMYPLTKQNAEGKESVSLPRRRNKSVYVAGENLKWLSGGIDETSLMKLQITSVGIEWRWFGKAAETLKQLNSTNQIPTPLELLRKPNDYRPTLLITHDNFMRNHVVGHGIELADRSEIFDQLCELLPTEQFLPIAKWKSIKTPQRLSKPEAARDSSVIYNPESKKRKKPESEQAKRKREVSAETRLKALFRMGSEITFELYSNNFEQCKNKLLNLLGVYFTRNKVPKPNQQLEVFNVEIDPNGHERYTLCLGSSTMWLNIRQGNVAAEWLQMLPEMATEGENERILAEHKRRREIRNTLSQTRHLTGVLIEMPNYSKSSVKGEIRRRDPKNAVKSGLAATGRVSQNLEPQTTEPQSYESRLENALHDLLRQMNFQTDPVYYANYGTALPQTLHILTLWQVRVNSRRPNERRRTLPVAIYAPSGEHNMRIFLPSDEGARSTSYNEALLRASKFDYDDCPQDSKSFFQNVINQIEMTEPTLLLIPIFQVRDVIPTLKNYRQAELGKAVLEHFAINRPELRIALLRETRNDEMPTVYPTESKGKFQGLYIHEEFPNVYYSIPNRPLTATQKPNQRQIEKWEKASWSERPIEIYLTHLNDNDEPPAWANLIHRMREELDHSTAATQMPNIVHLAKKVEEYVSSAVSEEVKL